MSEGQSRAEIEAEAEFIAERNRRVARAWHEFNREPASLFPMAAFWMRWRVRHGHEFA